MIVHIVIPPKGVKFRSQADAQREFEAGQVWQCIGRATLNTDGGVYDIELYKTPVPARYSECVQIRDADDEVTLALPKAWALVWAPGRVSAIRYVPNPGERTVGPAFGPVKSDGLREPRTTRSGEVYRTEEEIHAHGRELIQDVIEFGGIKTSGGPVYRINPVRELRWLDRPYAEKAKPVDFDPDPRCKRAGDVELERYFLGVKKGLYNAHARRLNESIHGLHGNHRTRRAPDSDDVLDYDYGAWNQDTGFSMNAPKESTRRG